MKREGREGIKRTLNLATSRIRTISSSSHHPPIGLKCPSPVCPNVLREYEIAIALFRPPSEEQTVFKSRLNRRRPSSLASGEIREVVEEETEEEEEVELEEESKGETNRALNPLHRAKQVNSERVRPTEEMSERGRQQSSMAVVVGESQLVRLEKGKGEKRRRKRRREEGMGKRTLVVPTHSHVQANRTSVSQRGKAERGKDGGKRSRRTTSKPPSTSSADPPPTRSRWNTVFQVHKKRGRIGFRAVSPRPLQSINKALFKQAEEKEVRGEEEEEENVPPPPK